MVQPLTVRESGNGRYQLIAGERRLRAAKLAGLTHVPAFIRTADDQAMLELALVENIQREDLDAIDVAISYQRLIEECRITQEQLSDRVGKQRSTVANYLRLLKLPPEIQLGIKNKHLSMGHARTLINIEDPKKQIKVYYKIIDDDLSTIKKKDFVYIHPDLHGQPLFSKNKTYKAIIDAGEAAAKKKKKELLALCR
ncbi:MAG: ParB/RepB/Spo0J family partition protein [Syntrophobacteraceae bacterium]|nr:ParB/RepB/Spo0J family partition protein [Syntrophobacteraceae bacterium]